MLPNSAREKGKRFEKFVAQAIKDFGFGEARREIGSGSGLKKGDIFCSLPYLFECKNQKSLNWWDSINQAKRQALQGNWDLNKWALIIRDPRTSEIDPDIYAVIDFYEFLRLNKGIRPPATEQPDRTMKWHLTNLKNAINQVIKDLK